MATWKIYCHNLCFLFLIPLGQCVHKAIIRGKQKYVLLIHAFYQNDLYSMEAQLSSCVPLMLIKQTTFEGK